MQEQCVSPFHKSQVSYSDYREYKDYFKVENKDGYFTKEQVQYYAGDYTRGLDKKAKAKPVEKF